MDARRAPAVTLGRLAAAVDHPCGLVAGSASRLVQYGDITTPFPVASVTKLLCALAVAVAVEEGSLAYDDEVGPPGATLADLMAHTSGLPFEGTAPIAAPRTRRIYSNTGIEWAAAHLEARTGMTAGDYIREAVIAPLAMFATRLDGSPAHGAVSTAGDLGRLAAELAAPTLIAGSTWDRLTAVWCDGLDGVLPGFGRQTPNPWGLGCEIRGHKAPHWTGTRNHPRTLGHFGQSGACVWVDPVNGCFLAFCGARPFGEWARRAWPELADAWLAEAGPAPTAGGSERPPDQGTSVGP